MATSTRSHSKKMSLQNSSIEEPSIGGGGTKRKSCKIDFNVMDMSVDNSSMAKKKAKLYHPINNTVDAYSKNNSMATVAKDRRTSSSTSLPSPTDVRRASASLEENPTSSQQQSNINCSGQIKMLPPTLKGITDAAMVLHASKSSSKVDKDTTTLVSFPTESVYMLACCVKSASSRSVRKLISRTDDSQTSFSSSSSSCKSDEVIIVSEASSIQEHQGGISITSSLKDIIHPSNSSLDWIVKCSRSSGEELTSTTSPNPLLFVVDAQHALNYCHFTKRRTFAIRPPTAAKSSSATTTSSIPPPTAPSTPIVKNSSTSRNSFSPLPVYQAPSTPKLSTTATAGGLKCPPSTPITPGNTTNTQKKLCAANFSESREVFLRLSSKFWPGPVIFNVQVRTLGGEEDIFENEKMISTSTSMASLPSLLSSTGDLVAAGKTSPTPISAAALPILPESALIRATELLPTQGGVSQDEDRYFISMRCPSHPLSQKILKEIYHCPSSRLNTSPPTVAPSQSTESLVSISSMDDSNGSKNNSRPRSRSIAVVGCEVPTGSSINNSATTAADVDKVMSTKKKEDGSVFIVNGEDNREMFSVPTCQYGKSHPISLVIDGDNKTIRLIRHAKDGASPVTKDSVYRALIKPDTNNKEKKGDTSSIDRVISAVLSRWKIVESS